MTRVVVLVGLLLGYSAAATFPLTAQEVSLTGRSPKSDSRFALFGD